jgi:hypothetical protein
VKRDTVTDTVVYLGSHYEARFEEGDLPEDLDDDCDVDIVDIMLVAARWGTSCDNPDPDNNPDTPNYDPLYDDMPSACISFQTLAHSSMLKVWARRWGLTPALLRAWAISLVERSNSADKALRSCLRL